jgi:phosphoglycerate dehydrogenase-like enzyme
MRDRIHVWIPDETLPVHRSLLPASAILHDLPGQGALPEHLGPGQFLVATFSSDRLDGVVPLLDDLRVIQTLSAGVDRFIGHIPTGVILCDGSGIHDIPVSEWVAMTVLASLHNLPAHLAAQRRASWQKSPGGGDDLEGATVLILGFGSIGRAVEQRLDGFGVNFLRVALHERAGVAAIAQLPSLLPQADVVIVLLPLTESTHGLVDAKFMAAMRPGSLLVNASRGAIVDSRALMAALHEGRIRAALDVTNPEPLPDGHPLWSAPGVLITPHVAGWVQRRLDRSWRLVAEQIQRLADGAPLRNVVSEGY